MVILSFGGGTNSTALLVELRERGEPVDLIMFADTGGERPETYEYLHNVMNGSGGWLESNSMPQITIVRKAGNGETLEENCLRKNMLPSLAYGFKSCSQKFKIAPQDKFCNNHPEVRAIWNKGETVTKLIGYDADESHRWHGKNFDNEKYTFRAPLVEWNMGRDECIESIRRAGLPLPGKSSCFFCPASRKPEILDLAAKHPALLARALKMEAQAQLITVKGLGRRFAWADFIKSAEDQANLFPPEIDCGCYDGTSA